MSELTRCSPNKKRQHWEVFECGEELWRTRNVHIYFTVRAIMCAINHYLFRCDSWKIQTQNTKNSSYTFARIHRENLKKNGTCLSLIRSRSSSSICNQNTCTHTHRRKASFFVFNYNHCRIVQSTPKSHFFFSQAATRRRETLNRSIQLFRSVLIWIFFSRLFPRLCTSEK